jgi:MEDS: MEthanogen/methylotroph, DcmR Sensory domain
MENTHHERYPAKMDSAFPCDQPLPRFRGEVAPSEHIAQFYGDDAVFLDTLLRFVDRGLMSGEGVIVIATREHLRALEESLSAFTIGMATNRLTGAYIAIDAHEGLGKFMVNRWPDDELFLEFVMGLVRRASARGRRVRAFGEMVALLWAQGNTAATVRLEYLWNRVCKLKSLPLFCAYPKAGFTQEVSAALAEICAAHSRII